MRSRVVEKTPVCGAGEGIRIGKVLQLFLQVVQFGDVAAETDQTCFAIEHDGHLDRPVMPLLAIRAEKGFLEGDFFLFGKHDTVSLREQIGKLLPDQIGFQLADHFVDRLAVGDCNMLVGIEVASLPVLHVNGGIQVVEHDPELLLFPTQLPFQLFGGRDVGRYAVHATHLTLLVEQGFLDAQESAHRGAALDLVGFLSGDGTGLFDGFLVITCDVGGGIGGKEIAVRFANDLVHMFQRQ